MPDNTILETGAQRQLILTAAKKAGLDPQAVQQQLEQGLFDELLGPLKAEGSEMVQNLLSSPEAVRHLLEKPATQQLLNRLMEDQTDGTPLPH